jgi:hypothetical protein
VEEGETVDLVKKNMTFGGFLYFCILVHLLVWWSDSPCLPVLTLSLILLLFFVLMKLNGGLPLSVLISHGNSMLDLCLLIYAHFFNNTRAYNKGLVCIPLMGDCN